LTRGKLAAMRAAARRESSLRNSGTTGSRYNGVCSAFSSALNSATTKAVPVTFSTLAMYISPIRTR
jgi:hypothetical protein